MRRLKSAKAREKVLDVYISEELRETSVVDRSRTEPVPLREDARHDNVEQQQVLDEEPHSGAHRWCDPRVRVSETAGRIEAPRGGGVQRRLGRQQQRDDPCTEPGSHQDHRCGVPREGTGHLHGHLARAHQKVAQRIY